MEMEGFDNIPEQTPSQTGALSIDVPTPVDATAKDAAADEKHNPKSESTAAADTAFSFSPVSSSSSLSPFSWFSKNQISKKEIRKYVIVALVALIVVLGLYFGLGHRKNSNIDNSNTDGNNNSTKLESTAALATAIEFCIASDVVSNGGSDYPELLEWQNSDPVYAEDGWEWPTYAPTAPWPTFFPTMTNPPSATLAPSDPDAPSVMPSPSPTEEGPGTKTNPDVTLEYSTTETLKLSAETEKETIKGEGGTVSNNNNGDIVYSEFFRTAPGDSSKAGKEDFQNDNGSDGSGQRYLQGGENGECMQLLSSLNDCLAGENTSTQTSMLVNEEKKTGDDAAHPGFTWEFELNVEDGSGRNRVLRGSSSSSSSSSLSSRRKLLPDNGGKPGQYKCDDLVEASKDIKKVQKTMTTPKMDRGGKSGKAAKQAKRG